MRLVLVALLVSACGGGRCEDPPCELPPATCDSDADCFPSELCDFQLDSCGASASDVGNCVRRPTGCSTQVDFICGCDGLTYSNSCVAGAQGVDVDRGGGCPAPPSAFACGPRFCDRTSQLCVETSFGPNTTDFRCDPLPTACRVDRSCTCIDPSGFQMCRATDGGFTINQEVADQAATSSGAAPPASPAASR